jgi:hypothetical protein
MTCRFLFLLSVSCLSAYPQAWSTFLDPSRAINWTSAGFSVPAYTANCAIQPTLTANSSIAAAANTTAIQSALASCDATHNVVNIPAGTYYVAGWTYGSQGFQVVRGAGPNSTDIILTATAACTGLGHGVCMMASNWTYSGASNVIPPAGGNQCLWTAGYAQGATTITLSSCGGTPPVNKTIILDQADDSSDTNGVYLCDGATSNCTYEGAANSGGRKVNGVHNSLMQVVYVTGVTSRGGGSYTATISPGVYSTNIRTGQNPGAWWPGFVQNEGVENVTLDGSGITGGTLSMFSCYQCWAKNIRFIDGDRNSVLILQNLQSVVRDSYFYAAQSHAATSYNIEIDESSGILIENNIMQQVTAPLVMNDGCTGCVVGYNFAVKTVFADGTWAWPIYGSHNTGNDFNLFEGNNSTGVFADNASGPSDQVTIFRNLFAGYQPGNYNATVPFIHRALVRNFNFIGNVLGQPGYHTQYQTYATSTSTGVGGANEYKSIYSFGWGGTGPTCVAVANQSVPCDPLTFSTSMRWGNYDVVNAATQWNSTEASPGAVTYVNANFSPSYFSSLAQTLPASLYYSSKPSWWPSGKAWPPIGPDVSSGNVGICTGTYTGAQATSSSQCTGGTQTRAWASHANSIPAQDCYLNVMAGPPDGSGSVLSFDANLCYASSSAGTGPASPTGIAVTVR